MTRTKAQKHNAKKILARPKGSMKRLDLLSFKSPDWMTRAYKNNRYVVMIQDDVQMTNGCVAIRVMIQRHDDKPIPNHWREIQSIKNELFGKEAIGIEYYPPESKLVDDANVYWLWVFPRGGLPIATYGKKKLTHCTDNQKVMAK